MEFEVRLLKSKLFSKESVLFKYLPSIVFFIIFVFAWEILVPLSGVPRWLVPVPSAILRELKRVSLNGSLTQHISVTMIEIVIGFAIGAGIGLAMGIGIAYSAALEKIIYPLAIIVKVVPVTAIAPILVIWFGYGIWSKAVVVALICFFPFVVGTATGLRSVERSLVDLLNSLSASGRQTFFKVRLPWALPHIISALKIAVTMSVIGAVVGEFVGSREGLGYLVLVSLTYLNTPLVFATIFVLAAIGISLFLIAVLVERVLTPWAISEEQKG